MRPVGATPAASRAARLVQLTARRNLEYVLLRDPRASDTALLEAVTEAQRYNPWQSLQESEAATRMRRELHQRLQIMLQHRHFPRASNPRRRRRKHTAKFDRCVREVGASAKNPYGVCMAEMGSSALRSSRARNPRRGAPRPAYYTITAYKPRRVAGERVIRELYFKGDRFARGAAGVVKFPTRELAAKFARYLARQHFGRLRGWRLRVA